MSKKIQIAVVGSGYVGLVAAVCFAEMGHEVICVDNDETKVAALQGGDTLIHEDHLPELLKRYRNQRVRFMTDLARGDAGVRSDFYRRGDSAGRDRRRRLLLCGGRGERDCAVASTGYKVIVEKSTVPVYTNEWIRRVIERNGVDREHVRRGVQPGVSARRDGGFGLPASGPDRGGSGQ